MAAPVRRIDQFLSFLSRDTQIYLHFFHALIVLRHFIHFMIIGPDDHHSPPQLVRPLHHRPVYFEHHLSS